MSNENAVRFLRSYNNIESRLKSLYNAKPTQNFTDLVKRCSDLNITVRRYESELVDYGKLRNAIVHRTTNMGETVIANPCDEVVQNIEFIEMLLCRPPRVTDAIKVKKIATVFADKPLVTAVETFAEQWQKTLIVYDHGTGTISTIVCNWFGAGSPNLAKPDNDSSIQSYENIYDRNWLMKGNSMIMPGIERVDTIRTDDGWTMKSIWCRDDLSDTSMMKLSTATGYIYGFVQDVDSGMWQYIVLDFDTGKTVLTVDVASLYGYNNMAIGMYAGRDGNKLYCPTGYKELLRLQDRFVFLPEMPYRKVDLDKTSRRVLSAAEFQAAGGAGTPASWLHTATLDNLHPATTVSFRINGLTGNAADYKLFALGTDGRYHEVSDWHFDDAPARLSAKKVYTICLTAQDGGSFDLSPDAKEVTLSIVLAR